MDKAKRNILIIDDETRMIKVKEAAYKELYRDLSKKQKRQYELSFQWCSSIDAAEEYFKNRNESIDVALIDYEFCNDGAKARSGVDVVRKIREHVSKRCKIVFFTAGGIDKIDREKLLDLINNDVFRFIDKAGGFPALKNMANPNYDAPEQIIVEAFVDALAELDPFSQALESYMLEHSAISDKLTLTVDEKIYTFEEILDSIRMERDPGQTFVENLLQAKLMDFIELKTR